MTGNNLAVFPRLELWGGHECTINRVGDIYFDQSIASGHASRIEDIDRFAALGISKLRYPVLWESAASNTRDCWAADAPLGRLRSLGVSPILGLLHHGSGPFSTNLLSPNFPAGLADHARATAAHFPWATDWTPINEPLTTARFSTLYGHWYPHARDERSFWAAMLNQIDAIRLSMRAIREINSDAQLIQTEDLGKTFATGRMKRQAEFDNDRRWLTWDFLLGHVNSSHPLWRHLTAMGFADRAKAIADDPCPPAVIGVNHYLTSDRFLDHRARQFPADRRGRNNYGAVADVEAIRVMGVRGGGLESALREAWARYGTTIAVTEVHNGCTREEQMRWMHEAWNVAQSLRARDVNIAAVTAWSLLGSFGWNSLLTHRNGVYECGVFDVRSEPPRQTAMVGLLQALAGGDTPQHPVLAQPGWWRREERLQYGGGKQISQAVRHLTMRRPSGRPILITGATGTLGQALARECDERAIPYVLTNRSKLSLNDMASIGRALIEARPWAVINAAGWVRVDEAECNETECLRSNREGSLNLAQACAQHAIPFVTFSSDLVFDGLAERAYTERDITAPLNVYGRSKAETDATLLAAPHSVLVIRTAAFFSVRDNNNFAMQVVDSLRNGQKFHATDCTVSPTLLEDFVKGVLDLTIDGEIGLWHLSNNGMATWSDFAHDIARAVGLRSSLIETVPASRMRWKAVRPAFSPLTSDRGQILPTLAKAVETFAISWKQY